MKEYVTDALVLGRRAGRGEDAIADLLTQQFGRIEVRVAGGRKTLSKLAPHLDALNLTRVRLVAKNVLTLTDAETRARFPASSGGSTVLGRALESAYLLRTLSPRGAADAALWEYVVASFATGLLEPGQVLARLGYDARHARCESCGAAVVSCFVLSDLSFRCQACGMNFPQNEVVLL